MNETPVPASKGTRYSLFGLIGVAIVAAIAFFTQSGSKPSTETPTPTPEANNPETTPSTSNNSYKDGTYDVKGGYQSPAGPEQIEVKITLKNDVITDATVTALATNPKSVFMQGMFVSNYKTFVIGKNIDEVHLTKVSGSSLTPIGFNQALEKIKVQAKAS